MPVRFQLVPHIAPDTFGPFLMVMGKKVPVVGYKDGGVILALPDQADVGQIIMFLTMTTGSAAAVVEEGEFCKPFEYTQESIKKEMSRLVEREVHILKMTQQIQEPTLDIVGHNVNMDALIPLGLPIWDTIMVKPRAVLNLPKWLKSTDADRYVYLPNDLSFSVEEAEQRINNAFYTEVRVNAYARLCKQEEINPMIRLHGSDVCIDAQSLKPFMGVQTTVIGEVSARLANSTLVDFDDSHLARKYLDCILDLQPHEYEKEKVMKYVLGRVEHILMGRTSHKSNQKVIHALYETLIGSDTAMAWGEANQKYIVEAVLGILKQMAIDGAVLEDSKEAFLSKVSRMQIGEYITDLDEIYSRILST